MHVWVQRSRGADRYTSQLRIYTQTCRYESNHTWLNCRLEVSGVNKVLSRISQHSSQSREILEARVTQKLRRAAAAIMSLTAGAPDLRTLQHAERNLHYSLAKMCKNTVLLPSASIIEFCARKKIICACASLGKVNTQTHEFIHK